MEKYYGLGKLSIVHEYLKRAIDQLTKQYSLNPCVYMLLLRSRDYVGRIKVKIRNKTTTQEYSEIKSSMKIYTLTVSNAINVIYINDINWVWLRNHSFIQQYNIYYFCCQYILSNLIIVLNHVLLCIYLHHFTLLGQS